MENYIVINGKRAELTEEQLEKLGIKTEDPEEKYPAKFKVGDRVKVICSTKTLGRWEEYEGETFTIDRVYKLSDYPDGPAPNIRAYSTGKHFVVYENELESASYEKMFERSLTADYYVINTFGCVLVDREDLHAIDTIKVLFSVGNYCRDEKLMKQRALHETLNRLLWRASIIAGELDNPWNGDSLHYTIVYDSDCQDFAINHYRQEKNGVVHFPSSESALAAIENIVRPFMKEHPDFVW